MGDALVDQAGGPIPGVVSQLKALREFDEKIHGRDPTQPFDGYLVIQADNAIDFRLVRRVIGSANEAGWAKMKFVTIPLPKKGAGEEGAGAEG
jgi:hypothetical protein